MDAELSRRRAVDSAVDRAAVHLLLHPPTSQELVRALGMSQGQVLSASGGWRKRKWDIDDGLMSSASAMFGDNSLLQDLSRAQAVIELVGTHLHRHTS